MGYHIAAALTPEARTVAHERGQRTSTKIGVYGSQDVLAGLLFAGYTQTGSADAKRVCAWIDPIRRDGAHDPRYYSLRNRPRLVAELIADDTDGCAWITFSESGERTMRRGLKLLEPRDPTLRALVEFARARNEFQTTPLFPAEATAALDTALGEIIVHLEDSAWWLNLLEFAQVVHTAASHGVGLLHG